MKSIAEYTFEDIMLKLPIYKSISVDLTWGDEKSREYNNGYENEYYTETSNEFQQLVNFITSHTHNVIHGKCPKCNKSTYFHVGSGRELSKKLLSGIVRRYCDSQIDAECYIPELEEAMDSLCQELTSFQNALFFDKHFSCPECKKIYKASFTLDYQKEKNRILLIKVGQYPHLSLISSNDTQEYDKILEKFDAKEDYKKAIRNHTNGDTIGAYVYLRRVIEKYINHTFKINKDKLSISETDFLKKKTIDKISELNNFVPQPLVDNREIYSIVSLGIHELDEEECNEYYPYLKDIIEYVLSAELYKKKATKITSNFQKILREQKAGKNTISTT